MTSDINELRDRAKRHMESGRKNQIPIMIFSIHNIDSIAKAVCGKGKFTVIQG